MKNRGLRILIGLFIFSNVLFSSSCSLLTPQYEEDSYPVVVTSEQFSLEFKQFQSRLLSWEKAWGIPDVEKLAITIPSSTELHYNFYEFPSTQNSTCYFRKPKSIYIGHDKWQSGCVAHEIGHAVLFTLGHPCWGEFEHEEEKQKCQTKFR